MPPVEIIWGGEKWPNAVKRRLRPPVRTALDLATLCLEDLGARSDLQRRASIWCIGNNDSSGGSAEDVSTIELYVPHKYIRHPRRVGQLQQPLFLHAVHEIAHTLRFELTGEDYSLLGRAVSEGVSVWAEILAGERVLLKPEYEKYLLDELDVVNNHPKAARSKLVSSLLADHQMLDDFESTYGFDHPATESLHDVWFDNEAYRGSIPSGYVAGIVLVGSMLCEGLAFKDVVGIPADDTIHMVGVNL